MEEILTVRDAAQRKGISVATIYKAIEEGRLPASQILGRWGIRLADLDAFNPGSYAGIKRTSIPRRPKATHVVSAAE